MIWRSGNRRGTPFKQALDDVLASLARARARHQNELEELRAPAKEAARIEALFTSYGKACTDLAAWDAEIAELKRDKELLETKLAALATQHRKLVEEFSQIFNRITQYMLGKVVTGVVSESKAKP